LSLQKVNSDSSWSNGLKEDQLYFINRILNLYDIVEDSPVFGDSLNLIDNQALNKLNELDAKVILVTSAIAYKSKIYWSENFDVWLDAIQQYLGNNSLPKQTDLATIGKGEVKGAVGGVAGSVAEAVGELIDWLGRGNSEGDIVMKHKNKTRFNSLIRIIIVFVLVFILTDAVAVYFLHFSIQINFVQDILGGIIAGILFYFFKRGRFKNST